MNQDNTSDGQASIHASLQAFSVGSYLFQSAVAARAGLNPTDLRAISWLSFRPEGATASQLGAELGLTSGATTTAIDRLVALSYVQRTTDPADGRRVRVQLRPGGTDALAEEYSQLETGVDLAIAELSGPETIVVARFLARLTTFPVGK